MARSIEILSTEYVDAIPGDVRWAHGVNSLEMLSRALAKGDVDFIEADVSLSAEGIPIAAHPPVTDSDLTIAVLLERIRSTSVGLKLDFKESEGVEPVLKALGTTPISQPVLLNADVLSAHGAGMPHVDARWFIETAQKLYPDGIFSLGWRTNRSPACKYTPENIDEMIELCRDLNYVTFPIRASMLPDAWNCVRKLLEQKGRSLTIWNTGPADSELKAWIRLNTNPANCFYAIDISEDS